MGHPQKYFSIEERKAANRRNQAKYREAHKADMKQIYQITNLRTYYRKKLRQTTDPDEIAKIEARIHDLSEQLRDIKHQLSE